MIKKVLLKRTYAGAIEARAVDVNNAEYIVENAEQILLEAINSKGFSSYRAPRQTLSRLTINK